MSDVHSSASNHLTDKAFTPVLIWQALLFFVLWYIVSWIVTRFAWWLLIDQAGIVIRDLDPKYWPEFIIVFVVCFSPLLYLFGCVVAGRKLPFDFSKMVLYMGCTFFGAMWYEIGLDTLFVKFCGQPGWLYKIWPIHYGYTSGVGMFMWPLYGFFIYNMNTALAINPKLAKINNAAAKTFLFAIDAMTLEILTNIFAILFYKTFLFYYLPGDLLHFTTIKILIPYLFACGLGATLSLFLDCLRSNHLLVGITFYLAGVLSLLFIA